MRIIYKIVFTVIGLPLLWLGVVLISSFAAWSYIEKFSSKYGGFSHINDFRVSQDVINDIQGKIHPFNSVYDTTYASEQKVTVEYGLSGFIDCYKRSNQESDTLKKALDRIDRKIPPINWDLVQVPYSGFYEGDTCFAMYINPDKSLKIDSLKESAVFAEMLIRKVYRDRIKARADFHPSERIRVASFSNDDGYERFENAFGFWDAEEQNIVINSDSQSAEIDIGWRLIHEMNHSLNSGEHKVLSMSRYSIPEEALTEFIGDDIANHLGRYEQGEYSPAIKALLKYIDADELIDMYFNGTPVQIRDMIDSKTYDGAFCTYAYELGMLDAYGHKESDVYEKALREKSPNVPDYFLDCIY